MGVLAWIARRVVVLYLALGLMCGGWLLLNDLLELVR